MVIAVARVELILHGVGSLKDKRSIVKRIIHRTRNSFEISVAETDHMDSLYKAEVGLSVVSNDSRVADSVVQQAVNFIIDLHLTEVGRIEVEIIHF